MRNNKLTFFILGIISILFFSCCAIELDQKQQELDKNLALWRSKEINHYRYTDIPSCQQLCEWILSKPAIIYVSNRAVYAVVLDTNGFTEQDFTNVLYYWIYDDYLKSNTFEFKRGRYAEPIETFFTWINNSIYEGRGLFRECEEFTAPVNYDNKYGYPILYLNSKISNLQILD